MVTTLFVIFLKFDVTGQRKATSYLKMQNDTDQYLIQQTLAGDSRAYGELVRRYQDLVYTVAIRMLKVKEEAEEVAQDSFIKAYEALESYRGESKFSSWLYSIAYRKALDRIRKNKRSQTMELLEEITPNQAADVEHALAALEAAERKQYIQRCIAALPEQEAALVTFYYFEELSVKEIAAITDLSVDNIKVKLYRSRKKLFSLLKDFMLPEYTSSNGQAI